MKQEITYYKLFLEGSAYERGKKQGKYIAQKRPDIKAFLLMKSDEGKKFNEEEALERCDLLNRYSQGLGEEVKGLAAGLGVPLHEMTNVLNGYGTKKPCACSVTGVDGSKTVDGHSYIGQSYEYNLEDEYTYILTRKAEGYAHMGFAFFGVGRFDGMNEKGLCVAITSLEFNTPSKGEAEGFSFPFIVRILLDTCSTTKEALEKIHSMPICTNANIIIGDRTGDIVLCEFLTKNGKADIVERKADPFVYGFNHFIAKEHKKQCPSRRYFSQAREDCFEKFYHEKEKLSVEALKGILTEKLPHGACCHAYSCYFGTLRSMLYDLNTSSAYICFGSPQDYSYEKMDLWEELPHDALGIKERIVYFEDEKVPDTFWQMV